MSSEISASAVSSADPATQRPTRVRIAPSPTGDPHVGTAYIGLLNYIFAAQRGGQFILRIEDTDRTRFVASSEKMIFDALHWVGLRWDEGPDIGGPFAPYRQSERTEIYRHHAELLLATGHAYACFCTPEDLERARERQKAARLPPRYEGTCRNLTPGQVAANLAESKPFTIRLRVPVEGATTFRDELRGSITFDHANIDDQVLLKSDGFPTYHLANVVDDHLMQISDVIRAEEWISSTPKHVLLYAAFGWQLPRFWHMPLLRNIDRSKISKRKNPVSLLYYRETGYLPEALLNFLGLMGGGMAQPTEQEIVSKNLNTKEADIFSLDDMIQKFDFERISLGGPVFDLVKLRWMNGEYIRRLSPSAFVDALRQTILSDAYIHAIAPLVQPRIDTLSQFGDTTGFFFADNISPPASVWLPKNRTPDETIAFAELQLLSLESASWDAPSIESTLKQLGEAHQWSVKENFMLLRAIITGSTTSPPLIESLIVFGKTRSLDRMRRFIAAQRQEARKSAARVTQATV